jgi:hypothetical protein
MSDDEEWAADAQRRRLAEPQRQFAEAVERERMLRSVAMTERGLKDSAPARRLSCGSDSRAGQR